MFEKRSLGIFLGSDDAPGDEPDFDNGPEIALITLQRAFTLLGLERYTVIAIKSS